MCTCFVYRCLDFNSSEYNLNSHIASFLSFSAGIGRTGVLITIDVALGLMERDLSVCTLT